MTVTLNSKGSSYLIQMAGVPGAGKSTIARALGSALGAVVLDHDITKSALLDAGVADDLAGAASYAVLKALAVRTLNTHSVVIDSPCLYRELVEFGVATAAASGAPYRFIECQQPDLEVLDQRLRQRERLPSQMPNLAASFSHAGAPPQPARALIARWVAQAQRPAGPILALDTTQPIAACIDQAIAYVLSDAGTGSTQA